MRLTQTHTRVTPCDDQQPCRSQVLDGKPNPKADVAESVQAVPMVPMVPMVPSQPTRVKPARGPPVKRKPLLLRLRRLRDGCSKLCFSPIGAVLVICCFSLLYCVLEIFLPPPFGMNTGANGADCNATGFEPMPICICPRETVCVKDVKSLVFLALARCSAYFDYPLCMLLFLSKARQHGHSVPLAVPEVSSRASSGRA